MPLLVKINIGIHKQIHSLAGILCHEKSIASSAAATGAASGRSPYRKASLPIISSAVHTARRCSMEATAKMKNGEECDLLARLAAEKEFGLTEVEMTELLNPASYIGRCPEQVMAFVEKVKPLLAGADGKSAEINL